MSCLCESDVHERLSRAHRQLAARARLEAATSPAAILDLGTAVILHGIVERIWLLERHPLLEPAVRAQLLDEHDRLHEDLELLESLMQTEPSSRDLATLSATLLQRLQQHVARDERLLYRGPISCDNTTPSQVGGSSGLPEV